MDIEECLIIKHRSWRRAKKNVVSFVNSLVLFVVKKNPKSQKHIPYDHASLITVMVSFVNSLVLFVVKKNHKVTKPISLNVPKHRTVYEQWIYNGYTTVEERI